MKPQSDELELAVRAHNGDRKELAMSPILRFHIMPKEPFGTVRRLE